MHANQLAHRLVALGVKAEVPVGVLMERSPDLAVALLAVLKAGGAYVPMDPSYPRDRLALMLEDSAVSASSSGGKVLDLPERTATQAWVGEQAPVLLSQEKVHARVPVASKARVLLVSGPTSMQPHHFNNHSACLSVHL